MPVGDVWILGAGASAEVGAPTIPTFRDAAKEVAGAAGDDSGGELDSVLRFWEEKLRSFNIEELFGFVDSGLGEVTGEGDLGEMRSNTLFLIAKVITDRLAGGVSKLHLRFVDALESWVPIITLNWDILLDNAIIATRRKRVSYVFPDQGDYDPLGKGGESQKLLKLHGSLNWLYCDRCGIVRVLGDKEPAVEFLRGARTEVVCEQCNASDRAEILLVPPVLGKLDRGNQVMGNIWADAYKVLLGAKRVFIIGYSFPATDIQTKLFLSKALGEADGLREIKVVTRPKFGTARTQFEDRYTDVLQGSNKVEQLNFEYSSFGQYVDSSMFKVDLTTGG